MQKFLAGLELVSRGHQKIVLDTVWLVCHTDTEMSLPDTIGHTQHLPSSSSQPAYGSLVTSALQKLISTFTVKPSSVLSEVCNWNMLENGADDGFRDDLNLPVCRRFCPLLLPSSTKKWLLLPEINTPYEEIFPTAQLTEIWNEIIIIMYSPLAV